MGLQRVDLVVLGSTLGTRDRAVLHATWDTGPVRHAILEAMLGFAGGLGIYSYNCLL